MNLPRRRLLAGLAELAGVAALAGCAPKDALDHIAGGFEGVNLERGHALRDGRDASLPISRTRRTRVVIAGGGVAGLAAARALRQRGQDDFVLFELEDEAGGNSRSTRVGGLDCPIGAHYLPQPGDDASEVQALLEELGLCRRVAGRWEYDERQLCHSPQERLFLHGHWQDGRGHPRAVPPLCRAGGAGVGHRGVRHSCTKKAVQRQPAGIGCYGF